MAHGDITSGSSGDVDTEHIKLSDYLGCVELPVEAAKSVARRGEPPTRRLHHLMEEAHRRLKRSAYTPALPQRWVGDASLCLGTFGSPPSTA